LPEVLIIVVVSICGIFPLDFVFSVELT
jgi:hypothetical protein